ncbi:MAG: hypothetical protein VB042_02855 [Victivallaceae bacterium]|nr:hypothetical protein [Victivallaceae bacterium]
MELKLKDFISGLMCISTTVTFDGVPGGCRSAHGIGKHTMRSSAVAKAGAALVCKQHIQENLFAGGRVTCPPAYCFYRVAQHLAG